MWNRNPERAHASSSSSPSGSASDARRALRLAAWAILAALALLAAAPGGSLAAGHDGTQRLRVGAVFPGVVADKDFNELGHKALVNARERLGVGFSFAQKVSPDDAARVMRAQIEGGHNVIWGHGGQFLPAVLELCGLYPDVAFIAEAELPVAGVCPNVHVLGREYHKGFYVLGALAARVTRTNVIGYIGGLHQPFSRAQVNAALSAIRAYNPQATLRHVNVGDFNDPMHARQAAQEFIEEGCDVILSGLNMGNFGVIEAVNDSSSRVFFTTVYASKEEFSPGSFLTADLFDFTEPLIQALSRTARGMPGGFAPMAWKEGGARYTLFPIANVPAEIDAQMRALARDIEEGRVTPPYDQDSVPGNP